MAITLTLTDKKILEQELVDLRTNQQQDVARELAEARSHGDLSENAEYDAARDRAAKIKGRIEEIEYTLNNAEFVDESQVVEGTVTIGCKVTVYDMEYEEEDTYEIVGSQSADPAKMMISNESPIGKALLGAHVGEVVRAHTPGGIIELKINAITHD